MNLVARFYTPGGKQFILLGSEGFELGEVKLRDASDELIFEGSFADAQDKFIALLQEKSTLIEIVEEQIEPCLEVEAEEEAKIETITEPVIEPVEFSPEENVPAEVFEPIAEVVTNVIDNPADSGLFRRNRRK